jgi:hypothetical protein
MNPNTQTPQSTTSTTPLPVTTQPELGPELVPDNALILDPITGEPTWRYSTAYFRAQIERANVTLHRLERVCELSPGYLSTALGVRATVTKKKGKTYASVRRSVDYELAHKLAKALGLDPHEVGL